MSCAGLRLKQFTITFDEDTGQPNINARLLVLGSCECGGLYTAKGLSAHPLCEINP
jgi:hypothetical protein